MGRIAASALFFAFLLASAGPSFAKGKVVAKAKIEPKSDSKLTGNATFTDDGKGKITLKVDVSGVPAGTHAVHIHDKGDCSSPDGASAGGHWNPTSEAHGAWTGEHHHLGDVGNMEVNAKGKGTITLETDKWTVSGGGTNDVVGHAIVVHGGTDDFTTQPTGNAGNRIGCGVIEAAGKKK